MSRHSFDPEIAAHVGMNAAVIYQNIVRWCEKNAANGKHIHEGRAWTYNSVKAFADLFPYMTQDQIRRALQRLEEAGYVGVGNFNTTPTDRTKWFCDLRQMDLAPVPNGNGTSANSYKDTDSKPVVKPDTGFEAFWAAAPRKVGKGQARKAYQAALKKTDSETIMRAFKAYAKACAGRDERYIAHPATWLNGERWDDEGSSSPASAPIDIRGAIAERIKSGKPYLTRDITPATARELIASGLVTEDECRKAGIA